ncbi:MAG: protein-L-isoaspartate O-methyltransferase [Sphingomonadales bacterium]|nr:protein-L-isoaspartate O-methyltransferase [Sphingomonadales bacterium]MBU3992422.1 protein-L-isoaspartate O-methyltransferase [Alphaproteobacteria bacterium]
MTTLDARPSTAARPNVAQPSAARRAMIDSQLRVSGVNDPAVLAAIDSVVREDFVPDALKANAYIDRALPLGGGHFLPAPLAHGRMLMEAAPGAADTVLVVSPSGYLAAVVAAFGCTVSTLSPAEAVAAKGKGAAVSLILVDGAIEQLPAGLAARLAEGGRIVTGLIERGVTRLAIGTKAAGAVTLLPLAEIGFPVLPEFAAPERWSF